MKSNEASRTLEISISTCEREPSYVREAIETMCDRSPNVKEMPFKLWASASDGAYLEPVVKLLPNCTVVADDAIEDIEARAGLKLSAEHRAALNFARLLIGRAEAEGPLLALEDDVALCDDWLHELHELVRNHQARIERHPKRFADRYVIALYHAGSFRHYEKPLAKLEPYRFYGNQAIYFSPPARRIAAEEAAKLIDRHPRKWPPADMFLKHVMQANQIDLFVAHPNLAQHIGEHSSLGLRFHKSPTFAG